MPLKHALKDEAEFNALAEPLRDAYRRNDDGTYTVDIAGPDGFAYENVTGLKTALGKERENARNAERARRELEEKLGTGDSAALRAELESQRAETAARDERIANLVATGEMREALAKHKGNPHTMIPVLKTMTKVEGGRVIVLDAAGKLRDGVTCEALVAELRERDEFASAFAGTGQSGGGSASVDTSKGNGRPTLSLAGVKRSTMSVSAKAAYIKEHGTDKFMELPW